MIKNIIASKVGLNVSHLKFNENQIKLLRNDNSISFLRNLLFTETSHAVESFENCPLDKDELGNKTWGFLHTMSVYLPTGKLEASQQTDLRSFIELFSKFYPCDICASDMRKDIKDEKPVVDTGYNFAQWLCRLHNKTNVKLGKPSFDCNKIFERWKDGPEDSSCD